MKLFAAITLSGLLAFFAINNVGDSSKESVAAFIATSDIIPVQEQTLAQELPEISDSEIAATYKNGWIPLDEEFMKNNILD